MEHPASTRLGDPALDEEHARLHQRIQELLEAPAAESVAALEVLRDCAIAHFTAEDADLRAMRDANAQCHLDEHAAVLTSLDEVHAVLIRGEAAPGACTNLVRRLAVQLGDWLPHHVQEMDEAVARHRVKQRFGGAPVRISKRSAT